MSTLNPASTASPIAATILTGFLGAGKTTLLQRILTEAHGRKIAVIENEFGPENIDTEILRPQSGEHIVQMNNGCVCCSIREDLRATLCELAAQRQAGTLDFERVVIETTGLADPGPVAQTFFMDDEVAQHYLLDAIVTVVDAKHGMAQLDERLEAQRQAGFADHIFISKADLVDATELDALQRRLAHINARAPRKVAHFGQVPLAEVLDVRGFNLNERLEIDPHFLHEDDHAHEGCGCGAHCCGHDHHDHHHDHHHHGAHEACTHHDHRHNDDVGSFVYRATRPFDPSKLEDFLAAIVQVYGPKMYRYKGVLDMQGAQRKIIFQGVHQLMGSDLGPQWEQGQPRVSKMVFIGVDLPRDILVQGLEQCLSPS